jgi:hypothetical protein
VTCNPPRRGVRWRLGGLFVPLAVTAVFLATAAGASALKYVTRTKTVPSTLPTLNGRGQAEAPCPASNPNVAGGGVKIIGDNSDFDLEVASTSADFSTPDKWLGEANNSSGSDAQMTTTAICSASRIRHRSDSKVIPVGGQATKRVLCPEHTRVIGGGVATEGDSPKVEVASSKPIDTPGGNNAPDDGWSGSANNGTASGQSVTVDALCAPSGHYRYIQSDKKPVPNNSFVSAHASCPNGTSVIGGGVENSGIDIGAEIESTFPLPDLDWVGRANNDNIGRPETVQTFAICKT